ncbi:MAG: ATP-dependent Clp protease ATP-binding subunit [Clostridia bacterium]|nr:ATP-dependent Clp protease ATP-binding subunit [Clostridia bacterium]
MLCVRCKKRAAVVFVTRFENNKPINEGLCLQCARECGLSQVEQMVERMGLSDEDIENLGAELLTGDEDEPEPGKAPTLPSFLANFLQVQGKMNGENSTSSQEDGAKAASPKEKDKKEKKLKFLESFCIDLTARAREGKLDQLIGRDREVRRVVQILCRRQKNNPCLIGEPGVGKTAIAEGLALRIAAEEVPSRLINKRVYLLDLTSLVAGTQFRGQFESRMKGLIEEIRREGNIILVIDEVHNLVGAGDAEGSMNAANILKPALSRGEIQVIGATTLAEYRKHIEKDAALERRFQPVVVEEPSLADTVEILKGIKGYYEHFHGVRIPDTLLPLAVGMSERYITDRFLPDKAIDLIDEGCANLALNNPVVQQTEQAARRLAEVRAQLEQTQPDGSEEGYRLLADLRSTEMRLSNEFDLLSAQRDEVCLTDAELAEVIELWTGIPASKIRQHELARLSGLEERLQARIIGQDEAVSAVARAIRRNRAGVSAKKKPVSFIFVGPTGVGKTELVKQLALDLFDSPESMVRLDMSEFMEKHAVSRLIGSPPGYVGYDEAGQLTEKIRRKPYTVILFDEIEKAHPDVLNILLQILDDGQLTDAHGKTVNFEHTVIIMTSNAGSNLREGAMGFGQNRTEADSAKSLKALEEFLRPEFINRVDEIITFRHLSEEDFARIAWLMLKETVDALQLRGIAFSFSNEVPAWLARRSFSEKYGARNLRRLITRQVEDPAANLLISDPEGGICGIFASVQDDSLILTGTQAPAKAH